MSFMLLTVAIWALSFIRLLVAAVLYWPLLVCHIRGNLKEYCCHKVDKRISQILADRRRRRNDTFKLEKPREPGTTTPSDTGKYQPTLPKVELDGDGGSVISMPLYPLSRSDTGESRRGLLSRQDTMGSQPYLARTNTGMSTNSNLSRGNTSPVTRMDISRTPSRPGTAATTDSRSLTRDDSPRGAVRQPTLPHLVGDFFIPELPRSATTRPDSRNGRISPPRPSTATSSPPSAPPRINTQPTVRGQPPRDPSAGRHFGPPPRSNTAETMNSFRAPIRSNTAESERGYGPPLRNNTNPAMQNAYPPSQRGPVEKYGRGYM